MTRAVLLAAALALGACKHEPEPKRDEASLSDVVAGELMVGTKEGMGRDALLQALELDGYRFEYVAAASATAHLVKVTALDGGALTPQGTQDVAKKLGGRAGLEYVELNHVRQPR